MRISVNIGIPPPPSSNVPATNSPLASTNSPGLVSGKIDLEATISSAEVTLTVDGNDFVNGATAELIFYTRVKNPYELVSLEIALPPLGFFDITIKEISSDCNLGSDCTQQYSLSFSVPPTTCEIDGIYHATWEAACRDNSCNHSAISKSFSIDSESLCPGVDIESSLSVVTFVAFKSDSLDYDTSQGSSVMYNEAVPLLFEATLSADYASSISSAVFTDIWVGSSDDDAIPKETDSDHLVLRKDSSNVPLPGTSVTVLSSPNDELPFSKLPGSAFNNDDDSKLRTRFLLFLNKGVLGDFTSRGGPNLLPNGQNITSFSINARIVITVSQKKNMKDVSRIMQSSLNTATPSTTIILDGVIVPPSYAPNGDINTGDKKSGLSAGAIAGIVVGIIVLLIIGFVVFFVIRRRGGSSSGGSLFGFRGPSQ
eukprot:TRINITY_DN410_c0_g1_i5.p1 TRINITY_DN410_c0_g1~~TRINITY_DN410_c0_g1_i5.p1  ORF type:complete len:426 (+),score=97.21 TRINITY_DN410_c0_g1_i5:504-1781(+)